MSRFMIASALVAALALSARAGERTVTPESREAFYTKIENAPAPTGANQKYSGQDLLNGIDIGAGWRLCVPGRGHLALLAPDGYYHHVWGDPAIGRTDGLEAGGQYGEFRRSTEILAITDEILVCLLSVDGKGAQDNWGYLNEVWVLAPGRAIHVWSIWHNDGACAGEVTLDPFYVRLDLAGRSFAHGHTFNFIPDHYLGFNGSHFVTAKAHYPSNHGGEAATKSDLFEKFRARSDDFKVLLGAKPEQAAALGVKLEDLQQMMQMRQALAAGLRPASDPINKRGVTDSVALRKAAEVKLAELRSERGLATVASR